MNTFIIILSKIIIKTYEYIYMSSDTVGGGVAT